MYLLYTRKPEGEWKYAGYFTNQPDVNCAALMASKVGKETKIETKTLLDLALIPNQRVTRRFQCQTKKKSKLY